MITFKREKIVKILLILLIAIYLKEMIGLYLITIESYMKSTELDYNINILFMPITTSLALSCMLGMKCRKYYITFLLAQAFIFYYFIDSSISIKTIFIIQTIGIVLLLISISKFIYFIITSKLDFLIRKKKVN